jgi:hypothetical protein
LQRTQSVSTSESVSRTKNMRGHFSSIFRFPKKGGF